MLLVIIYLIIFLYESIQLCPEEVTKKGIAVTWHESQSSNNVLSSPICYYKGQLVTRNCNASTWSPTLKKLPPCLEVVEYYDLNACPPGYNKVTEKDNKFCYQIGETSPWESPCLNNGGASVITDLSNEEYKSLIQSLNNTNSSRYYWLPAQRRKLFNPVVWNIPGPNWGQVVNDSQITHTLNSLLKNCLMLDVENSIITTETCSNEFPSLCIYLKDARYPAKCPSGYYGFRYMSGNGTCFGIEKSDKDSGFTYDDFMEGSCSMPMGNSLDRGLTTFLFMKIAQLEQLPDDEWCWFERTNKTEKHKTIIDSEEPIYQNNSHLLNNSPLFTKVINSNGTVGIANTSSTLSCIACGMEMKYYEETTLDLEYSLEEMKLHLTIYFPSGLWKNNKEDNGFQCFSDASGFVTPIKVNNTPLMEIMWQEPSASINSTDVEKTIFTIDPVTNRSAQYWCEGHDKTLSLITSVKIIANPGGNIFHVFAIVLKIPYNDSMPDISGMISNLTISLKAEKVLLMDFITYTENYMLVLMHLHVAVFNGFNDSSSNIQATYDLLLEKVLIEVPSMNVTFINMTSCLYCLPTTSTDYIILDWELTKIGHTAAPKQFCLQNNGLPVKRNCLGSYLYGGIWGEVEGNCNEAYEPSTTTTFLYNFAQAQFPDNYTSWFLTEGLGFVLDDVETIIPADIYYLAMSLQHVINVAEKNESSVDMGDVDNMSWAMDRILILNNDYLRLAQTFNSTNIILESINEIIEQLARQRNNSSRNVLEDFQLCIKPQFVVQISYPEYNNITGIALIKTKESDNFTDMKIQPLFKNTTIETALLIKNLEVATWIPESVLDTLETTTNDSVRTVKKEDIYIVITLYHNDAIFQQLDPTSNLINSRIVGLTIPGYKSNLINPIPLLFKDIKYKKWVKKCGYWDFQTKRTGSNPGFWSDRGCYYKKSERNITVCQCYHMTNFGQLLDFGNYRPTNNTTRNKCHLKALNTITLVGSFLSLFGIFGIWLTALVFANWRKKPGTKVLLQLSTAIALPLIFMVVFNLDNTIFYKSDGKYVVLDHKRILCIVLGALLQYSILASFMWMLITAILQFVRYVRVFGVCRPSRFMMKFTLIGWGIPMVPVTVILAVNPGNYVPEPSADPEKRICYPSGIFFLLGIILPISLILLNFNFFFFYFFYFIHKCDVVSYSSLFYIS